MQSDYENAPTAANGRDVKDLPRGSDGAKNITTGRGDTRPDFAAAAQFLQLLDETAESFHFRTFDDNPERSDRKLARKFEGPLERVQSSLADYNRKGAGVFVVVNAGGQRAQDIARVRTVFADADGAPLAPLLGCGLEPHIVVETSPGRYHAYWLVDGLDTGVFAAVQASIAGEFNTDPSVIDLPRVMRLPGFVHRKGDPVLVRIVHESGARPYCAEQIARRFPALPPLPIEVHDAAGAVITRDRHAHMLRFAARAVRTAKQNGAPIGAAVAMVLASRDAGLYSREVPDVEIRRAVEGAWTKYDVSEDAEVSAPASTDDPKFFTFRSASELVADRTVSRWLVRDWFELLALVLLFGDAASCKTWLAIGLALHIAAGVPWFGSAVFQGAVFVIAGEGFQGLRRRLASMAQHYGIELDGLPLFVSDSAASFTETQSIADVITAIRALAEQSGQKPVLVIVDTLARNFGPGDENSTQDMGAFVRALDWVRNEFGCTVLVLHHVGHGDKTRARGNTTLRGALDVEYRVMKDEAGIVNVECTKAKDFDAPPARRYTLQNVPLPWIDEDGLPVHGAALVSTEALPVAKGVAGRGKNQTTGLRLLREAYAAARSRLTTDGRDPDAARVRTDQWRDLCAGAGLDRRRFDEVRRGLEATRIIRLDFPHVVLAEDFE